MFAVTAQGSSGKPIYLEMDLHLLRTSSSETSEASVPWISIWIPWRAFLMESLDPAYIILDLVLEVSGALYEWNEKNQKKR